jgi:hypothetical protein
VSFLSSLLSVFRRHGLFPFFDNLPTRVPAQRVLIDFTLERQIFFLDCHLEPLSLQENSCFLRPALGEPTYRLLTVETVSIKEKIDRF